MKAYQVGTQTGLDSLTAITCSDPVVAPGEALLKVRYAALNNRDIQILEGRYGAKKPEDRIPFSEGVGEIVAVGEAVTSISIGDRAVFAHFATWLEGPFNMGVFAVDHGNSANGWGAEYIKVSADALVKVSDALSDEQVAPLASAALTAWNAVVEVGHVKPGDLVLALGTGGVAIWTLQIAKALGARVAITSSSEDKLEIARKLGADFTVNYSTYPDWPTELLRQTGGLGADIIAETGGQSTLPHSIAAAAANARIVLIAVGSTDVPLPNYGAIIGKNLVIKGIAEGSRAMLIDLLACIETNNIQPVIDRVFTFDEAPAALAYLKGGGHVGKVLVRVSD